jgi:membrane-bound lytic murein transglycosylase MltF
MRKITFLSMLCICLSLIFPVSAKSQKADPTDRIIEALSANLHGDIDQLMERGFIRILSVHNPLFFNLNSAEQGGILYDISIEFEKFLIKKYGKKARNVKVILIPVSRDRLLPYLADGKGDIAVANLTILDSRKKQINFTIPTYKGVKEILVTSDEFKDLKSFDELKNEPVYIRESSSYLEHLKTFNAARKKAGKSEIKQKPAEEYLEDYDLLEMMNAGVLNAIIVDSHKAKLWAQVFPKINLHESLAIKEDNEIAWAVRKDAPELLKITNEFVKTVRKGSLLGNVLIKKYFKNKRWIKNVRSESAQKRYKDVVEYIQYFSDEFSFDWLMITAQGYQESQLDQSKKSHMGAIGVMQVLPTTAKDRNVNIPDIYDAKNNINAGVKYLRHLRDQYYSDDAMTKQDQVLFAFAAYNAGPGNVNKARRRAKKLNFDPNKWFENVEVAMAQAVSREPVIYVRNIMKYYVSYKLLNEAGQEKEKLMKTK